MINLLKQWFLPLSFFMFISYIIFLADTANYNFAFKLIGNIPNGDKISHAILYGVMALLLNNGLKRKSYPLLKYNIQLGATIVLIFATIEECTQYYIPSRTFDLGDLLADFIGILFISRMIRRKNNETL